MTASPRVYECPSWPQCSHPCLRDGETIVRVTTFGDQRLVMMLADEGRYREAFEAQVAALAGVPASRPKTRAILAESTMWLARKAYRQILGLPPEPGDMPRLTEAEADR